MFRQIVLAIIISLIAIHNLLVDPGGFLNIRWLMNFEVELLLLGKEMVVDRWRQVLLHYLICVIIVQLAHWIQYSQLAVFQIFISLSHGELLAALRINRHVGLDVLDAVDFKLLSFADLV